MRFTCRSLRRWRPRHIANTVSSFVISSGAKNKTSLPIVRMPAKLHCMKLTDNLVTQRKNMGAPIPAACMCARRVTERH